MTAISSAPDSATNRRAPRGLERERHRHRPQAGAAAHRDRALHAPVVQVDDDDLVEGREGDVGPRPGAVDDDALGMRERRADGDVAELRGPSQVDHGHRPGRLVAHQAGAPVGQDRRAERVAPGRDVAHLVVRFRSITAALSARLSGTSRRLPSGETASFCGQAFVEPLAGTGKTWTGGAPGCGGHGDGATNRACPEVAFQP